jgi:hypothetical protein
MAFHGFSDNLDDSTDNLRSNPENQQGDHQFDSKADDLGRFFLKVLLYYARIFRHVTEDFLRGPDHVGLGRGLGQNAA